MLFGFFLGLSGFLYTRDEKRAHIDDYPFRMHYGLTCALLFISSALIGITEITGELLFLSLTAFLRNLNEAIFFRRQKYRLRRD